MDKAPIKILSKDAYFADIFSLKLAVEYSKYTKINNYIIKLVDDWQLLYDSIYNLGLVKFKILKAYIENNLTDSFIKSFKSPVIAHIFFDKKLKRSLILCVNYQGLNNLIIKN